MLQEHLCRCMWVSAMCICVCLLGISLWYVSECCFLCVCVSGVCVSNVCVLCVVCVHLVCRGTARRERGYACPLGSFEGCVQTQAELCTYHHKGRPLPQVGGPPGTPGEPL